MYKKSKSNYNNHKRVRSRTSRNNLNQSLPNSDENLHLANNCLSKDDLYLDDKYFSEIHKIYERL